MSEYTIDKQWYSEHENRWVVGEHWSSDYYYLEMVPPNLFSTGYCRIIKYADPESMSPNKLIGHYSWENKSCAVELFQRLTSKAEKLTDSILEHLAKLNDSDRATVIDAIVAKYCTHCYREKKDFVCHCRNDE